MRSKSKKKKGAYRPGERMTLFFRKGTIVLFLLICAAMLFLGVKTAVRNLRVMEIVVTGNRHLERGEVLRSAGVREGTAIIDIDLGYVDSRLRENPWIRAVSLKKQFPGTLLIRIEESSPRALLSLDERLYLLDADGRVLERIKGDSPPFLPVLKGIHPEKKEAMTEALKLVAAIDSGDFFSDPGSVEIGLQSYGLSMNVAGELIMVGYEKQEKYDSKLARWKEIEPEVRSRGVPLQYIDLRFKDSVVVKPVDSKKEKRQS